VTRAPAAGEGETAIEESFLTAEVAAVPCVFKVRPEDFEVSEVPLYPACGEGEHLWLSIEKRGIGTFEAMGALARALGVHRSAIGCAGLKDAQGVARQTLSIRGGDERRATDLALPGLRVLAVTRHRNKLRVGHLAGNRFRIRLREIPRGRAADARVVLETLARRGVPNGFGPQRFGARGDGWRVGRALLRGESAEAIAWLCGRPGPRDFDHVRRARELFDGGEFERAAEVWPRAFGAQRALCRALTRSGGDAARAIRTLDRRLAAFLVSAWQSWIFNRVLAARLATIDRLLDGEVAVKHASGGAFRVTDPAAEGDRLLRQEISPSGPLFGRRMLVPEGEAGEIEDRVRAECGATREEFERPGPLQPPGGRRPLRFPLGTWELLEGDDAHGPFLELLLDLPPGAYATSVLREVGKEGLREGAVFPRLPPCR